VGEAIEIGPHYLFLRDPSAATRVRGVPVEVAKVRMDRYRALFFFFHGKLALGVSSPAATKSLICVEVGAPEVCVCRRRLLHYDGPFVGSRVLGVVLLDAGQLARKSTRT
jgi:hypothetical protein